MEFDLRAIKKAVFGVGGKIALSYINPRLEQRFKARKVEFLNSVRQHPVSQELINWTVPSAYLTGSPYGSLFGFLGLRASYKPVDDLIQYLEQTITFIPSTKVSNDGLTTLNYKRPGTDDLTSRFPLLWHKGLSWVDAIEKGVSNLGNYLAINNSPVSNSTQGIQSAYPVHPNASFSGTDYLTGLFQEFDLNLNK